MATPPKKYQIILAFCIDNPAILAYNIITARDLADQNQEEQKWKITD
jgi:hypothetical protein